MGDSEKEDLSQEETWQEKCNDTRRGMCKQRALGGIEKSRCKGSGTWLCLRAPGRWSSWSAEAGRPGRSVCGARGPWEGFMFSRGNLCCSTLSILPSLAWPHNSPLYAQTTLYPFICWWIFGVFSTFWLLPMQAFVRTFVFLSPGYIPISEITGSSGNSA